MLLFSPNKTLYRGDVINRLRHSFLAADPRWINKALSRTIALLSSGETATLGQAFHLQWTVTVTALVRRRWLSVQHVIVVRPLESSVIVHVVVIVVTWIVVGVLWVWLIVVVVLVYKGKDGMVDCCHLQCKGHGVLFLGNHQRGRSLGENRVGG